MSRYDRYQHGEGISSGDNQCLRNGARRGAECKAQFEDVQDNHTRHSTIRLQIRATGRDTADGRDVLHYLETVRVSF